MVSKPFVFEKPLGMRDVLPEAVDRKNEVTKRIRKVIQLWGYQLIETPTIEYYDIVGGVSSTIEQRMFKLLDRSGRSLVLRPDMTAPIARVVGSLLKEEPFPIRLAYQGSVFRAQEKEAGRNAEFQEIGVELIGEEAPDADAEVIALAVQSLQSVQVPHFKFAIGHVGFMNALLKETVDNREKEEQLRYFLHQKNYVGYRHYIETESFSPDQREQLAALLELRGGAEQIESAKQCFKGEQTQKAVQDIQELWDVLTLHQVEQYVLLDFSLIGHRDYYSGVLFEGYADPIGFPICNGGRYDHLLGEFGRPAPATGFALKVDRILEASQISLSERKSSVLVTYTDNERQDAFRMAQELRQSGQRVTLHRLTDREESAPIFTKSFEQIFRLEQQGG